MPRMHGRPCRPHFRTRLRFQNNEALVAHRELELLRAAALPRGRKGRAKRIRERSRKLDASCARAGRSRR
jgi:hypothetical protein